MAGSTLTQGLLGQTIIAGSDSGGVEKRRYAKKVRTSVCFLMTVRLCQVLPLQLQSLSDKVEGLFLSSESAVQAQTPKAAADSGFARLQLLATQPRACDKLR